MYMMLDNVCAHNLILTALSNPNSMLFYNLFRDHLALSFIDSLITTFLLYEKWLQSILVVNSVSVVCLVEETTEL